MWHSLYHVFTYFYSILIKKDIYDHQNISVKFVCFFCPEISSFFSKFSLPFPIFLYLPIVLFTIYPFIDDYFSFSWSIIRMIHSYWSACKLAWVYMSSEKSTLNSGSFLLLMTSFSMNVWWDSSTCDFKFFQHIRVINRWGWEESLPENIIFFVVIMCERYSIYSLWIL